MPICLPESTLQLQSAVRSDGTLELAVVRAPIILPVAGQVLVRMEAVPINPSDLMPMLAGADPASFAFAIDDEGRACARARLSEGALAAARWRIGTSLPIGLVGAGRVEAAGEGAEHLLGHLVSLVSAQLGTLAEYCTVPAAACIALPDHLDPRDGADIHCNPMTVMAIVETLRQTGQQALVHTAAASALGQMLARVCVGDGIPLVGIVRRVEQADLLRSIGVQHVCVSTAPSFRDDLLAAVRATGAMVAFDAIGGGTMAADLLLAMERVALEREGGGNPYGSATPKTVYVYGRLDPAPTVIPPAAYGLEWAVAGWAMPPVMARAGEQRAAALTSRIVDNLTTTFATRYADDIPLSQVLSPACLPAITRKQTDGKYLVRPGA